MASNSQSSQSPGLKVRLRTSGHVARSSPTHTGTSTKLLFATRTLVPSAVRAPVEMSASRMPSSRISELRTASLLISGERTASVRIWGDPTLSGARV